MKSLLFFFAFLAGMVLIAWIVSKLTGSHVYYLADWKYDADETILWRDDEADAVTLAKTGQALFMTFPRLHRSNVVVTNKRIIVAKKAAFTKRPLVMSVMWPHPSADGQSDKLGGGVLTVGYETFAYVADSLELTTNRSKHPCIELKPMDGQASSTNISRFLIFTDKADSFQLPKN